MVFYYIFFLLKILQSCEFLEELVGDGRFGVHGCVWTHLEQRIKKKKFVHVKFDNKMLKNVTPAKKTKCPSITI
jgi:hypothetical protein